VRRFVLEARSHCRLGMEEVAGTCRVTKVQKVRLATIGGLMLPVEFGMGGCTVSTMPPLHSSAALESFASVPSFFHSINSDV